MASSREAAASSGEDAVEQTIVIDDVVDFVDASGASGSENPSVALQHSSMGRSTSMPALQRDGRSKKKTGRANHTQSWDTRHHLSGVENQMLPKKLRAYFSKPTSLPEVKQHLTRKGASRAMIENLDREEESPPKPTPITADAGPAVIPQRHFNGGTMTDIDGTQRPWNDRFHTGIGIINEGLHPLHRGSFATKSVFEKAPSQRWRRHLDVQAEPGTWLPTDTKRQPRFPPLGV